QTSQPLGPRYFVRQTENQDCRIVPENTATHDCSSRNVLSASQKLLSISQATRNITPFRKHQRLGFQETSGISLVLGVFGCVSIFTCTTDKWKRQSHQASILFPSNLLLPNLKYD